MNAITKGYQDVPMTRRRAQLLAEYADKLAEMLENAPDDQDLAEWIQSKIDRAAGAIQSAYHYLDQEDDEELEKAVGHKYTHRKRVGTDKKGRARYRYYYAEHQGGGITRASFEAGSAFKLTWKGRRGHFHIDRVEGDQVFITHDSRPNMEPVAISKSELRALLKRQHTKAEQAHVEKRRKEVEKIKSRNVKRGLGLALHRLRQAATQAGVELDERYQREPKKKPAQVTDTPREDRFDTMLEVEAPEKGEPVQDERFEYGLELEALAKRAGLKYSEQGVTHSVDARLVRDNEPRVMISAPQLQKVYPKLTQEQVNDFKARAIAYLKEFTGDDLTEDIQHTAQSNQTRSRMIYKELDAAISHIINEVGRGGREERRATLQAVKMLAEWREATAPTPRNELTETAQQIIEEANQDHEERHDEHQEITKFELGEHTHTKTGAKLFTAKQTERVDRDEYFRRVEIAKKHRGRYERRYVKGFVFKSAEDARNFALEVEGAAQTPESAETVTPHEDHPSADNFETMPEVESAPRSRVAFREKVEELKRLEDELIDFTSSLARPQGLTKEQEKDILDKMQAEIAKKRDELTEGFTRPQSSAELEARLKSFLPKLKGLDYSRVEGYRLYIDKEHKAPLRAQIKELMGTGLNITPVNQKNYGLNVAGSFKDMVRLLFALENDAKETPRGHLTPSRLYGMDHQTASWHDIVDATGQGDLSGRKLKDLDLSEIQTSIDFYVSILENYKDDPRTYKRFRRQTDKKLRDLKRYVRTRKAEGRIKGERPPAPPESKPTPTPTADLTQQEKRDALLSLMPTTPRDQLTETAREVTQGADNFETMPEVEAPKPSARERKKARAAEFIKEDIRHKLYQNNALLNEEDQFDGLYQSNNLASLKRSLEPERLAQANKRLWDYGLMLALDGRKDQNSLFKDYLNHVKRGEMSIGPQGGVRADGKTVTGIAPFLMSRLDIKNVKDARANEAEIEQLATEIIRQAVGYAVQTTRDIAAKRKDTLTNAESGGLAIIDHHARELGERASQAEELGLTEVSREIDDALEQTRQTRQAYTQRAESLYREAEAQYSEGALLDGLLENMNTRYIFSLTPKGRPSKKHTETIIKRALDKVLDEVRGSATATQPTAPARQALTETVRELSDQPARTAAVSSTPRASEATLTGSGDLSDTERRDLTNRARFITSGSEETTKTGRRSRAQKAKDQELLLIYNRLHSDASARLGPLAPRFADYSQFVKLQGGDLPERAQTRADFRTGIMSSIEELRNATTAQPTSSTSGRYAPNALDRYKELHNTSLGVKADYIRKLSDEGLKEMRDLIDAESARVRALTQEERTAAENASLAMDQAGERMSRAEDDYKAAPLNKKRELERVYARARSEYADKHLELRRLRRIAADKYNANINHLVGQLSRPLEQEERKRARRTQKSANHLINYRAQLLQTIERIA